MNTARINLARTLLTLLLIFVISCLPIFLSFVFKLINPKEYGLLKGMGGDLELSYKEILFFTSLVLCLFMISSSLRFVKNNVSRPLLIFIPLAYLTLAFVFIVTDVLYYLVFAYNLTFSVIQTIINTDPEEAKDFLRLYASPGVLAMFVLALLLPAFIFCKRKWVAGLLRSKTFYLASLIISVFGCTDFIILGYQNDNNAASNVRYWDITIGEYKQYNEFTDRMKAEKDIINLDKNYDDFYNRDTLKKTVILVVSESLSKRHMSLYGYNRKTTPRLDSNPFITTFNDCVTPATLTSDAVPYLFYDDFNSKHVNLVPLLNKLGYETSWISNQSGWGKRDGAIVLLAQLCGTTQFNHALSADDESNLSNHYDGEILGNFEKVLNTGHQKSRFIVLHLMGCHFDYQKRYPKNRDHFRSAPPLKTAIHTDKAATIINAYDNAVLYHDSVIERVLMLVCTHANKDKSNAALVFVSDHGEELYENRDYFGHAYPPTKVMSEIPSFIYLSEAYKICYPAIAETVKKRVNTPYSTVNNFYSILNLLNIGSDKYKDDLFKKSFLSGGYDSTGTRYVMGFDYKKF